MKENWLTKKHAVWGSLKTQNSETQVKKFYRNNCSAACTKSQAYFYTKAVTINVTQQIERFIFISSKIKVLANGRNKKVAYLQKNCHKMRRKNNMLVIMMISGS